MLLGCDGNTEAVPQVYLPTQHLRLGTPFSVQASATVLNAGRDEYKERPCVCPSTSGPWAVVSSDDTLTEVLINHRVALLDVSGKQTYPSQAGQIDQFEFLVVDWELRNRL